jgi:hypothetical protein
MVDQDSVAVDDSLVLHLEVEFGEEKRKSALN